MLFNKSAERIFGYSTPEVVGQPLDLLLPKQLLEEHLQPISEVANTLDLVQRIAERLSALGRRKDGSEFPAEVSISASAQNGQTTFTVILRDITRRTQTREALRESEERYHSMITAMQDGVIFQDANGVILTCNASAERMLGLSADQMMGRTSLDPRWQAIHEDGSPFPGDTHPSMVTLRTGQPLSNVVMGVHKSDSALAWISINSQPLFHAGESSPYGVVVTFADITDRRQAEQAVSQLAAIVESSDDAITSTTMDGIVVSWNAGAERLYGYAAAEIIGHFVSILLPPERHDELTQLLDRLRRGESTRHFETTRRAKDGRNVDVSLTVSPIKNAEGQVVGTSTIARDIAERVRAYQLLEQRVEKRTRELTTLLEISHTVASTLELKPLLRVIIDQLKSVVSYTSAAIFTLENEELVIVEYEAPIPQRPIHPLRLPLEQAGLGQDVIRCREYVGL